MGDWGTHAVRANRVKKSKPKLLQRQEISLDGEGKEGKGGEYRSRNGQNIFRKRNLFQVMLIREKISVPDWGERDS